MCRELHPISGIIMSQNIAIDADIASSAKPAFSENEAASQQALPDIQVIKRQGQRAAYDSEKISNALKKAFVAVEGAEASASARVRNVILSIVEDITVRLTRRLPSGGCVDIEDIQDLVELGLMRLGFQRVARAYVIYREEHKLHRLTQCDDQISADEKSALSAVCENGDKKFVAWSAIDRTVQWASSNIDDVDPVLIKDRVNKALFDGMKMSDIADALILSVRPLIERDPGYSHVCARLLLNKLAAEMSEPEPLQGEDFLAYSAEKYSESFISSVEKSIQLGLLSDNLRAFDWEKLAGALVPERDFQFNYLGLQTLYDRYLLQWEGVRLELPQCFFMRVAMGLAINEDDHNQKAIEFYHVLSSFRYMTSTPTLFNSGTCNPQLSSCYLTSVPDDLDGIYESLKENALLSKWSGGLGNDWTRIRALGARIAGTNGQSQGVVPFLKVVNDTAVAVNQGGKRKGAVCAYLETWHLDIEEFLELRKNTGDDRRRTHDMNTANWIPDLFMKRVFEGENWTLFSPDDVPDLHELYGDAFEQRYTDYESMADRGEIRLHKKVPAEKLWRKMLSMLFETGHPWITFKDPSNIRSPQQHLGVVHSSNLCTEITLNTSDQEIAVCNLGSINLPKHIKNGELNIELLEQTVNTAVRMLDNVIDINFYAVDKARQSNLKHRPVGLGIMGFQDALYDMGIAYASEEAVAFADQVMEVVSFYAIKASAMLAQTRGRYSSFSGSLWDKGILPIDSQALLAEQRGNRFCTFNTDQRLNWDELRSIIAVHGMRNSNVLAIAPTATISNIVGVSQSIEPTYQNIFVKSNLSGEFTVVNPSLVQALKKLSLWDDIMLSDLKYFDGSLASIDRVPESIKQLFATAFEIDSRWLVEAAARRQKWIDQAQSINLYVAEASGKYLDNLYKLAWSRGLKTTYYLRSLGATHMEKSVEKDSASLSKQANKNHEFMMSESDNDNQNSLSVQVNSCFLDNPECEACQ